MTQQQHDCPTCGRGPYTEAPTVEGALRQILRLIVPAGKTGDYAGVRNLAGAYEILRGLKEPS